MRPFSQCRVLQVCRIKRRAATDVDALRILEVVAAFQLASLIAVMHTAKILACTLVAYVYSSVPLFLSASMGSKSEVCFC